MEPAKHEEGAICIANQRIPNVCRIARARSAEQSGIFDDKFNYEKPLILKTRGYAFKLSE